jgi:hypothetical protein
MKRYWISALAVGVGLAIGVACGPKANDDDLCASEGGYCTAESSCGNVLPFACGEGSVCCQPGASAPTPNPTSTSTPTTTPDASTTTTTTTPDAGSQSTADSSTTSEKDSAAPTETDAGKDSGVEDSGSKDAAKD